MAIDLLTEEIISFAYNNCDNKLLKEIEEDFFNKVKKNQQQYADWLAYDFLLPDKISFGEMFLHQKKEELNDDKRIHVEAGIKGFLSIYEVIKKSDNKALLKNLFTHVVHSVLLQDIVEDVEKHDMVVCRLSSDQESIVISNNIIVLPCQFKTMLVGYVVENYDMAKKHYSYLTYEEYFKKHSIELLKIIDRLLSFQNQAADVTLYQSNYAVKDYNQTKKILDKLNAVQETDDGIEIYLLKENKKIIAEISLQGNKLEVACNSKYERNQIKKLLEEQLNGNIIHMKDEELTIDDLL
ncbi:hypothetical protein [Alkaliphilus peptidifermentans]|uniref:Uncharacterized protein n=1 Tax=Alkaliphilus peptidifermentans DSM 18978 TaxID=1120976 RepID=A0A1G5BZR2_9FIRM|nr:hypothetical protein [Alkaliphilus peptidifermentans]SCX95530.1 hypothetical protein SAMN03080606_00571 [Alkaliphilus peptidifermentans DSM 18978]